MTSETTDNDDSASSACYAVIDGVLLVGKSSEVRRGGWRTVVDETETQHMDQRNTWYETPKEACRQRIAWLFSWKGRKKIPDMLVRAKEICKAVEIMDGLSR